MTDEQINAVFLLKEEADRLRLACIAAAGAGALLHLAYDHGVDEVLSMEETVLLGRLRGIQ